jgi:hypothetical protein
MEAKTQKVIGKLITEAYNAGSLADSIAALEMAKLFFYQVTIDEQQKNMKSTQTHTR